MLVEIKGFPGYSVNKLGQVFSGKSGKFLKPQRSSQYDYRKVALRKDGVTYQKLVHKLVIETFTPKPIGIKLEVNHIDGDKTNNNLKNLEYVTHRQNAKKASDMGLHKSGENSHKAKLSSAEVIEIRKLLAEGLSQTKIGRLFGVQQSTVGKIYRGERRSKEY